MASVLWLPGSSRIARADSHSLVFSPSTVTLENITDSQTVALEVTGIGTNNADTVQINIVHDDAVIQVSNPACAGIYTGGSATSAQRVDSDTATAFSCSLQNGPTADSGAVMTFTVTRLASGEPLLTLGSTGPFLTAFVEAGSVITGGSLGTLQIFVNHAPVADDQVVGTNEDIAVPITLTGSDDNDDPLTFAVVSGPSNGALSGTAPDLTYTPTGDFNGGDSFTYTATDDKGATSVAATVTLTVTAVNDEPSFTGDGDDTVLEDAGAQTVVGWATSISSGPADESSQVLTFLVTNDNNGLFSAQPALSETTGNLTYTPAANANGAATVSVQLSDNGGTANGGDNTSPTQQFTITVTAVNDQPSFTGGSNQTVLEDSGAQSATGWATGISAGPSNESTQVLTFAVGNDNNSLFSVQPSVSATTGELTYTPASDANGSATVTVAIQDDGGVADGGVDASGAQNFTITVTAVNDAPSFTKGADESVLENSGSHTVTGWATAISAGPADEAGQVLTFAVSNDNNPLFTAQPAITAGGELSYTLASETNGSTTVTVQLSDDGLTANGGVDASPAVTFTITIGPVFDVTGTITLQGATTAAEVTAIGATVTLTPSGGGPAFATVTVASDGTFTISDAPMGTYTIRAEADGYQAAERTNLAITTSDVAMPTIELKGGLADISDTTDTVDGADVSLVTSSFGTVTEDRTNGSPDNDVVDINGDGAVSAIDISIMVSNLGLTGTQAW